MKTIPALILSLTALVSTSALSADPGGALHRVARLPDLKQDDPVKAGLELSFRRMLEDQRVAFDERRPPVMSVEQYYGRAPQEAWRWAVSPCSRSAIAATKGGAGPRS